MFGAFRAYIFNIILLSSYIATCLADRITVWEVSDGQGGQLLLPDLRQPALYTTDFGDCLGSSQITITRFDAALYKDNMTVSFHLQGHTTLKHEAVMLYIGVFAYGSSRFDLTFNPCGNDMNSLCPVNRSVPIEAAGSIPLAPSDLENIPNLAYTIPDFEGQAILRIFANSTQSEIACYSAQVTNGASFSQPAAVGTILGIFTVIAMVASFATAIYGDHLPTMRTHYAHSLSILVVFAVFHHIFFTGALSMNWPSVLVAWWSNFAWTAGMIYTDSMQRSIDRLVGRDLGNTSLLGAAGSGTDASTVGGGYDIHTLYRRAAESILYGDPGSIQEQIFSKRSLVNTSTGYNWYGAPVRSGLPLPGNYSGFAGTLAIENIPAGNAFMTGFLWLLILLFIVIGSILLFKIILDILCSRHAIESRRFDRFRCQWRGYLIVAVLRTCFIAFFTMMFLAIFQFSYSSAPGPVAIASLVFCIFLVGMLGTAGYAIYYSIRETSSPIEALPGQEHKLDRGLITEAETKDNHPTITETDIQSTTKPSLWQAARFDQILDHPVHEDEDYIQKFGWLASRYRKNRWWFFAAWLLYELVRACFYAGASGHAMVQVFGLLVVEIIAFIAIIKVKPYEGQRLNMLLVYLLGFSKVITIALSAAFDVRFDLPRITTTAIGIVIIVVQGLLVIALLITILVGAVSSYMSLTRHREEFHPRSLARSREKYFTHLQYASTGQKPPELMITRVVTPELDTKNRFSVRSVKRMSKIEDEDIEFQADIAQDPRFATYTGDMGSVDALEADGESSQQARSRVSRAFSVCSATSLSSLPSAARLHRGSWITREFAAYQDEQVRAHEAGEPEVSLHTWGMTSRRSLPLDSHIPPVPSIPDAFTRGDSLRSFPSMDSIRSHLQYQRSYQVPHENRRRPPSDVMARSTTNLSESLPLSAFNSRTDLVSTHMDTEDHGRPQTPENKASDSSPGKPTAAKRSPSYDEHRRRSWNLLRQMPGECIDEDEEVINLEEPQSPTATYDLASELTPLPDSVPHGKQHNPE